MHRHTFVALCVFLSYWPPCQRGLGRMGPPSRNILGLVSDTSPSIILPDLDDDHCGNHDRDDNNLYHHHQIIKSTFMIKMVIIINIKMTLMDKIKLKIMIKIKMMIMIKTKTMTSGRETQLRSPFYSPLNSMWQVTIVFTLTKTKTPTNIMYVIFEKHGIQAFQISYWLSSRNGKDKDEDKDKEKDKVFVMMSS